MKKSKEEFNNYLAPIVFYRTYSRKVKEVRERWEEMVERAIKGVVEVGKLTLEEEELIRAGYEKQTSLASGRWMWCGGTEWVKNPENYYGGYNCMSTNLDNPSKFKFLSLLAMCGTGTGAVLEEENINKLPVVKNRLKVTVIKQVGVRDKKDREDSTKVNKKNRVVYLHVGDSKEGWAEGFQALINLALEEKEEEEKVWEVNIDLGSVRKKGERLKGFGGISNPAKLEQSLLETATVLNGAVGKKLNAKECCLLIDISAAAVVAGNIRRSAGQRQFSHTQDSLKENLWQPNEQGVWMIDKSREAMQMANHTRNYYHRPSYSEIYDAVSKQFWTGEGAIFNVRESLARCNADIFPTRAAQRQFMKTIDKTSIKEAIKEGYVATYKQEIDNKELEHRSKRKGTNPCFTADTLVYTSKGDLPIKSLVDKTVNVWDGYNWLEVNNFRVTGTNKSVYTVYLSNNKAVTATYNHTFILVDNTKLELNALTQGDELKTYTSERVFVKDVMYSHNATEVYCCTVPTTNSFALSCGLMVGNCGEIIGNEFLCDLSEVHLNQLDPYNEEEQKEAFQAGALNVVSLLHHKFLDRTQQESRELDPIVAVGCTGGFDFFVNYFGTDWLEWWNAGRRLDWSSSNWKGDTYQGIYFSVKEEKLLKTWKNWVREVVIEYCKKHNLKIPNRYTTIKPSGTQSLLTKATSGWGPPKGIRYIRRITVGKDDPIALAAIDCGYPVVPSSGSVDESGKLLDDPYDSRVSEWMIEVPIEVSWANLEDADKYDPSSFPIESQFSFYMQWQKHYVTHNTSATLEIYEEEIKKLAELIHEAIISDEGFVSAAVTSRSHQSVSHPRLPFESISKEKYEQLMQEINSNRISDDFYNSLKLYDLTDFDSAGPAGCDSDACEIKPVNIIRKS